jgi:hypothetical protein
MTLTEQATAEWLERELDGLRGEELRTRLKELAPTVSLTYERATSIYRRYRYEQRYAARYCEVNRKYGVVESSADPAVMAEMIDEETFRQRTGWGNGGGEDNDGREPDRAEMLASAAASLLDYLQPGILKLKVVWKFWRWRKIREGETVEQRQGPGTATLRGQSVSWLACALVIVKMGEVTDVFPEAKVKRHRVIKKGALTAEIHRLEISGEQLNRDELCRRFAAMLRLYKGSASGLRSQVHLAQVSGVTKQAVNDMSLRMKQFYHRSTGGRAQFENVSGKGPRPRKPS